MAVRPIPAYGALLFALLAAAACDDSLGPEVQPQVIEETTFDPSLEIDLEQMTKSSSGLYFQTLREGEGEQAAPGNTASVDYVGHLSDGRLFDSGTYEFELGANEAIAGFDQGVTGMRVGELRRVVVPPELAYGNESRGVVPAGAILVFDLDLKQLIP